MTYLCMPWQSLLLGRLLSYRASPGKRMYYKLLTYHISSELANTTKFRHCVLLGALLGGIQLETITGDQKSTGSRGQLRPSSMYYQNSFRRAVWINHGPSRADRKVTSLPHSPQNIQPLPASAMIVAALQRSELLPFTPQLHDYGIRGKCH